MKTKFYLLLGALFMTFQFSAFSQDDYILWVTDQDNDQGFIDLLVSEGYDVHVKTLTYRGEITDQVKIDSANNAKLIIMSRTAHSQEYNYADQWNGFSAPLICLSPWLIRSNRWMWFNSEAIDTVSNGSFMTIIEQDDPIFKDAMGVVDMYIDHPDVDIDGSEIIAESTAGNGKILSISPEAKVMMASWEAGQNFYDGSGVAAGKRIFFPAGSMGTPSTSAKYNLTPDGEALFLNAVGQFFAASDINDIEENSYLSIYPNPASGILNVDLSLAPGGNVNISIYDITGKELYHNNIESITDQHLQLDISYLQPGIYMISINDNKTSTVRKIEVR